MSKMIQFSSQDRNLQSTAEQQNVMSIEQLNIKIRKSLKGHNAKVNVSRKICQKEGKETDITLGPQQTNLSSNCSGGCPVTPLPPFVGVYGMAPLREFLYYTVI